MKISQKITTKEDLEKRINALVGIVVNEAAKKGCLESLTMRIENTQNGLDCNICFLLGIHWNWQ